MRTDIVVSREYLSERARATARDEAGDIYARIDVIEHVRAPLIVRQLVLDLPPPDDDEQQEQAPR